MIFKIIVVLSKIFQQLLLTTLQEERGFGIRHFGFEFHLASDCWCALGQVSLPLCASVSLLAKWRCWRRSLGCLPTVFCENDIRYLWILSLFLFRNQNHCLGIGVSVGFKNPSSVKLHCYQSSDFRETILFHGSQLSSQGIAATFNSCFPFNVKCFELGVNASIIEASQCLTSHIFKMGMMSLLYLPKLEMWKNEKIGS